MVDFAPTRGLADAFLFLSSIFGEGLRFSRDGIDARWSYDGCAAIVELREPDRVLARFLAPPAIDEISGRPSAPEYLREINGYPLTDVGCERMAADMAAFFSGAREPHFTFVAAH